MPVTILMNLASTPGKTQDMKISEYRDIIEENTDEPPSEGDAPKEAEADPDTSDSEENDEETD